MIVQTNHLGWKLTHVWCIFAHVGLIVASTVAYVQNMSKLEISAAGYYSKYLEVSGNALSAPAPQRQNTPAATLPPFSYDTASLTLPMGAFGLGLLGLVVNIGLFLFLLAAETTQPDLTESEQHWRKTVVTFFSCTSNVLLAGFGIGLAAVMGGQVGSSRWLIAPMVWAGLQAFLSLTIAVLDGIKNYREGLDLLD